MSIAPESLPATSPSFSPPAEADWHRRISEAAYFIAERRGFVSGHALEDWLKAEFDVGSTL